MGCATSKSNTNEQCTLTTDRILNQIPKPQQQPLTIINNDQQRLDQQNPLSFDLRSTPATDRPRLAQYVMIAQGHVLSPSLPPTPKANDPKIESRTTPPSCFVRSLPRSDIPLLTDTNLHATGFTTLESNSAANKRIQEWLSDIDMLPSPTL